MNGVSWWPVTLHLFEFRTPPGTNQVGLSVGYLRTAVPHLWQKSASGRICAPHLWQKSPCSPGCGVGLAGAGDGPGAVAARLRSVRDKRPALFKVLAGRGAAGNGCAVWERPNQNAPAPTAINATKATKNIKTAEPSASTLFLPDPTSGDLAPELCCTSEGKFADEPTVRAELGFR
jgi:hypothetical protein